MTDFPVFDLGAFESADPAERAKHAAELDRICRETGFLAIANHGVDPQTISNLTSAARAFFDRSPEEKHKVAPPYPGYPYGYLGPGTEALAKSRNAASPPDLKESFNGGPLKRPPGMDDPEALAFCFADNLWPENAPEFRDAWQAYYRAMTDLASRIMRAFAEALDLETTFFDPFIQYPVSAMRALNYPELEVAPPEGQLRAGAHSDYGSLTILLPDAGSRGLEIFTPEGTWREVPPVDGAFVINIGDLMARWTNDRWVSTLHRVVNVAPELGGLKRRQSIAFFHQPDWHAEIATLPSCLAEGEVSKYEPVLSGPYLMSKFKSTVM
ncbi:isopenicillin N synthase family oxygenase [Rhizobium sp. L1K21]|uniref:isopenicillin N synthase family dioxygenase n=1 Tax=Rhizobium sp. L1K21 TaxID=2954933 RepID=UPI0020930ABE|nr:2-oxoglutarate and iron-dependent oxygenase domain-containing protein [Rhizobium sp. L1K21]MCO6186699.1 isopenicillin N synthase family oxygenase [Rhizobium sp. L1K21]